MRYSRDFSITPHDTLAFYRMLALRRCLKGALGFAIVGALVSRLYMEGLGIALGDFGSVVAMIAGGIFTAALVVLGTIIRTNRRITAALRKSGRERYVQQTRIDGFGVHVTVNKDAARVGFDKLIKVLETKDAFYLFITETDAWILLKSQMEDPEEECRTIREVFSRVVAPHRLKLKK